MNIQNIPFTITDWGKIKPVEIKGHEGTSFCRTFESGNIRVRMVEYSPGFKSDNYCSRGNVLLVLEGELKDKLNDGRNSKLSQGMSFQVEDDDVKPHLVYTKRGTKVIC